MNVVQLIVEKVTTNWASPTIFECADLPDVGRIEEILRGFCAVKRKTTYELGDSVTLQTPLVVAWKRLTPRAAPAKEKTVLASLKTHQ